MSRHYPSKPYGIVCLAVLFALAIVVGLLPSSAMACGGGNKCHPVVNTTLGAMAKFSLASLQPLVYRMNARGVMLAGFTPLPETTALLSFDAANKQAYIDTYGTLQWFFANGTYTYVAQYGFCMLQVDDGTFQDLDRQYSGLLHATTFEASAVRGNGNDHAHHGGGSAEKITLHQYVGHITLTTNPHAVVMTVDDEGVIHTMDATGPQDEAHLLGGVYSMAYALLEHAAVGAEPWATFPSLPPACYQPIPYRSCLLSPAGCPAA